MYLRAVYVSVLYAAQHTTMYHTTLVPFLKHPPPLSFLQVRPPRRAPHHPLVLVGADHRVCNHSWQFVVCTTVYVVV